MTVSYLLLEDGSKIEIEDSSGFIILEAIAGSLPAAPVSGAIKQSSYHLAFLAKRHEALKMSDVKIVGKVQ